VIRVMNRRYDGNILVTRRTDGFGGLVVSMLVPEFAGSNPAEAVGFLRV
jgi:hypothetical protein